MEEIVRSELKEGVVMYRVRVTHKGRPVVIFVGVDESEAQTVLKRYQEHEALVDQVLDVPPKNRDAAQK